MEMPYLNQQIITIGLILLLNVRCLWSQDRISDAAVINYQTSYIFDGTKITKNQTTTIQINNNAGEEYGEIEIYYSKLDKLSDVQIRLEDQHGNMIRLIKKDEITDRNIISNGSLYEDHYIKKATVKHSAYPYRITYSYSITTKKFTNIAHWSPVLFKDIPTFRASLQVTLPKKCVYNVATRDVDPGKIDSLNNTVNLTWQSSYNKQVKSEIFALPENYFPYVIVTPLRFNYGIDGMSDNWNSLGKWYSELTNGLDILPETEQHKVKEMVRGIDDKKEIVKQLYHYLQDHTRYINVTIGIGGYKPYPASYVGENKYGDCKALTSYMKALLKAVNIESNYVLVNAGEQPQKIIPDAITPQFNHVILAVPLKEDTVWLENTQHINPAGYLGTFTQNRNALFVAGANSRLIHIPGMTEQQSLTSRSIAFKMTTRGDASVEWYSKFSGEDFERFNEINTEMNQTAKDQIIRDYIPFANYEVAEWQIKQPQRDSLFLELYAKINVYKQLKPLENNYYFSLHPIKMPRFTPASTRTLPIDIPYPVNNTDTLTYILPQGYIPKNEIQPYTLNSEYGNYEQKILITEGKLQAIKHLMIYARHYELSEYPKFYSFIKAILDHDTPNIVLTSKN